MIFLRSLRERFGRDDGFTLIEIAIVVVIISIMGLMVAPRLSRFLGNERKDFALLTGLIARTFDNAFIHNEVNYLAIHLYEPFDDETGESIEDVFKRDNAVSVLQRRDGKFVDHERKSLHQMQFGDSFKLAEVLLTTGEKITSGTVLIPFYPQGYSDNVIIHVLVNDEEQWSIRIFKHLKEPEVKYGYIDFENEQ
jgi:prepilin-type N-terminal cleavage/methylation domain-containing protein